MARSSTTKCTYLPTCLSWLVLVDCAGDPLLTVGGGAWYYAWYS